MKVRFLADYDLNAEIVDGLLRRESSIDIKSGFEAGLQGVSDPDVLGMAADEGRVLVTHDHRTMPSFCGIYFAASKPGSVYHSAANRSCSCHRCDASDFCQERVRRQLVAEMRKLIRYHQKMNCHPADAFHSLPALMS